MCNDYRNTEYCEKFHELATRKLKLNEDISISHPQVRIMYNKIRDSYRDEFMTIYNYKCSYCGCSVFIIGRSLLEIDHFQCESKCESIEIAGRIENLVLACYDCNRSKRDFVIEIEYLDTLNPDNTTISQVFSRDDNYYIRISKDYENDEFINLFYNKLKFDYQVRRLDYLLLNIRGVYNKYNDNPKLEKLYIIYTKLLEKRKLAILKTQ